MPKYDRIPAAVPNCVFQDSHGFIWIGAQDGLIKYDGYTTHCYSNIPFDSTSLSANNIFDIQEDSKATFGLAHMAGGSIILISERKNLPITSMIQNRQTLLAVIQL
jgi:ligand-binding sensor domain-containing protein